MKQSETKFVPKIPHFYDCSLCDYSTCSKKDYNKHLITQKHNNHKNETNGTQKSQKILTSNSVTNTCSCGISFKSRTTLWRHKKKCGNELNNLKNDLANETKYIIYKIYNTLPYDYSIFIC
jgi:hypothetical protein